MLANPRLFQQRQKDCFAKSLSGIEFDVARYQRVDVALNKMLDQYGSEIVEYLNARSVVAAH